MTITVGNYMFLSAFVLMLSSPLTCQFPEIQACFRDTRAVTTVGAFEHERLMNTHS